MSEKISRFRAAFQVLTGRAPVPQQPNLTATRVFPDPVVDGAAQPEAVRESAPEVEALSPAPEVRAPEVRYVSLTPAAPAPVVALPSLPLTAGGWNAAFTRTVPGGVPVLMDGRAVSVPAALAAPEVGATRPVSVSAAAPATVSAAAPAPHPDGDFEGHLALLRAAIEEGCRQAT